MTTQVDAVLIKLNATTEQLQREMDKAGRNVRRNTIAMRRDLSGINQTLTGLSATARSFVGGFVGAFSLASIGKGIVDVARQTEKLRASLETVTGSASAANAAFDQIKTFTTETPFQVNEVADSFIKLAAYGIEPTEDLLRSLGNTASAMGKTLDQSVEALADATTGEFERLKEFGIRASSEGDRVAFTFRGVTTEVGKNADEIRSYLQSIGETDFAGAMERQMSTLGGAFSNLQDSIFSLTDKFASESGLTNSIKDATRAITDLINESGNGELAVTAFGKGIGIAIGRFTEGDASLIATRKERIAELESFEEELQNKLNNRRARRSAKEKEEIRQRLENTRALIETLKASLNDPDFIGLNNRGIADRLSDAVPKLSGQIVPTATGGSSTISKKKARTGKSEAEREAEQFAAALRKLQDSLDPASAATRDYLENVALLDRAWVEGKISGERYDELMAKLATDTDAVAEAERRLAIDREKAVQLIKDLDPGSSIRDQIIEVQRLRDEFPELSDALAEVELDLNDKWDKIGQGAEDAADQAESAWQGFGDIASSAFEDAVLAGKSLSDTVNALADDIQRLLFRNLVTKPLSGFLESAISGSGGLLSGIFGGARAAGGPVSAGRAYLVGERGPELFMPSGSGNIATAGKTSAAIGSTYNFSFVLPSDSVDFRRAGEQVARHAARSMRLAEGAV